MNPAISLLQNLKTWALIIALGTLLNSASGIEFEALRAEAETGDVEAQVIVAGCYRFGPPSGLLYGIDRGPDQDYEAAFQWYRKAANQGLALAQDALGSMYYKGEGVPQDYEKALKWFHNAADQGSRQARDSIGQMYEKGHGVPQDKVEAIKWFRKAAAMGYSNKLEEMQQKGHGVVSVDFIEAYRWYSLAAAQIKPKAEMDPALLARYGLLPRSPSTSKAVTSKVNSDKEFYRRATSARDRIADSITDQQIEKTLKWVRMAAKPRGDNSQDNLDQILKVAADVPQAYSEALTWARKEALEGDAETKYKLGEVFEKGQGVPLSHGERFRWIREAAEQGDAKAQHELAMIYSSGEGVSRDKLEALKWLRSAAGKGSNFAQMDLGRMHEKGSGVSKDIVEAYKWFTLAERWVKPLNRNKSFATEDRERAALKMTSEQIAEAKQRVAEFKENHPAAFHRLR